MATSRVLTAIVARGLSETHASVTTPQLRVLVMLSSRGSLNLTAVAEGLGVNASNASRTCDRLVSAGLVARREDPHDRRHVVLRLRARGAAMVEKLMSDRRDVFARIAEHMTPPDRRRLARGLASFLAATQEITDPDGLTDEGHLLRWVN